MGLVFFLLSAFIVDELPPAKQQDAWIGIGAASFIGIMLDLAAWFTALSPHR